MSKPEKLTHSEVVAGLSNLYRELIKTEPGNRDLPDLINKSKAAAGLVTALHREEIMESKRTIQISEGSKLIDESLNSLKIASEKDK